LVASYLQTGYQETNIICHGIHYSVEFQLAHISFFKSSMIIFLKVPKLKEGDNYLFRLIAVNDVGESEPSKPTLPIQIEEQANKPCMDLGSVRDITIRAGEDFSIHVPYVAFPKPSATWLFNDVNVGDKDSRIHQQVCY